MKLISTTDFVLEQSEYIKSDMIGYGEFIDKVVNYAKFLKQPLKLEMFVPCVNEEPFNYSKHGNAEQYEKAKEKVLFEGWEKRIKDYKLFKEHLDSFNSIEDVIGWDLTLTPNATKQFL